MALRKLHGATLVPSGVRRRLHLRGNCNTYRFERTDTFTTTAIRGETSKVHGQATVQTRFAFFLSRCSLVLITACSMATTNVNDARMAT